MTSLEVRKIYYYLASRGNAGASLLTIARETEIKASTLKGYFKYFSKSFVQVGEGPRFAINAFSVVKDHEKYILSKIEKHKHREKLYWFGFSVATLTTLLIATINLNGV